jgi:capsular polysaccharide biosynthesis protein
MGIEDADENDNSPLLVIFSEHSSESRDISMSVQMNSLKKALEDKTRIGEDMPEIVVEGYQFSKHTIQEQAKLVSNAAVYVTACGGGAATATFLPRGASLLLYYQQGGGFEMNKRTGKPAYLDWDYLNNVGYIRVHWVPDRTREHKVDVAALNELIIHELHNFHKERKQRRRHQ